MLVHLKTIFIAKFMKMLWNPYYGFNWTLFIEQCSISYSIPTTNIKVHYFHFFTKLFDFVKMSFDIEEPDNNVRCVCFHWNLKLTCWLVACTGACWHTCLMMIWHVPEWVHYIKRREVNIKKSWWGYVDRNMIY